MLGELHARVRSPRHAGIRPGIGVASDRALRGPSTMGVPTLAATIGPDREYG